ncbi:bifunctional diguanylate cyclase/phosphodiesterase [Martelella sp. HB161492]|uniref:sensor domain-containing protein n=1 Tax=Martelella sp. HB161492 TaxID=2720726 RepID=UPI001591F8E8|nr:bifunctional diguanylate cyclase/phosphodiesterase [Martelella sp. HB161492]
MLLVLLTEPFFLTEIACAQSHLNFGDVFSDSPVAMLLVDPDDTRILKANDAAARFYGFSVTTLETMSISDINQMSSDQIREEISRAKELQRNYFLFPHRFADGTTRTVRVFTWPIQYAGSTALLSVISHADGEQVTTQSLSDYTSNLNKAIMDRSHELEQTYRLFSRTLAVALIGLLVIILLLAFNTMRRRRLVRELGRQHLLLSVLIDAIPDQIYFKRSDGRFVTCNTAAAAFVGMPKEMISGKTDTEIFGASANDLLRRQIFSDVSDQATLTNEGEITGPTGNRLTLEMIKSAVIDPDGNRLGSVSVWRDVTERRRTEERIETLAYYDPLTGLANRARAYDAITAYLKSPEHKRGFAALILFDLDNFAALNSIFGHDVGDGLLCTVASRLSGNISASSMVARISSDEFVLLLTGLGPDEAVARGRTAEELQRLHAAVSASAMVRSRHITPSSSAGVILFGRERTSVDDLLRRADLALHSAKERGRGQMAWFQTDMVNDLVERFDIERDLQNALLHDRFRIYLQPKVSTAFSGNYYEALLRLEHPSRGIIGPDHFIGIAESTGMILAIGAWVLDQSVRLLRANPDIHLSVNVSVQQLLQDNFVERLERLIATYRFDPAHLTLEMTETLVIANFEMVSARLKQVRALGIRLSIDDFGTGYSALIYLKRLPIDELKIDRSFVAGVPGDTSDTSLVEFIVAVARHLHLTLVAEGVENEEQEVWLHERGCEFLQGYRYSEPKPVEHFLGPAAI